MSDLNSFVERIEKLEDEKKGVSDDIKDVYAEAKATGFNNKALRVVIARRKVEREKLEALDSDVELYEGELKA